MTVAAGHLVRAYDERSDDVLVGVTAEGGVEPLRDVSTISSLLSEDLETIGVLMSSRGSPVPTDRLRLLPPVDGATEVWAAGVTYKVSREARVEESDVSDVYEKVYDAHRPELFFKAQAWRVVTDGEPVAVRADSPNNVPEPEVGLVLNRDGDIFGFTVVDDVSSRSIEGENPLYLPQAKIYDGCCAIGPSIAPRALVGDGRALGIRMTITREGEVVFRGESTTGRMKRDFEELARFLSRQLTLPEGAVLATGTSVVPALDQTLEVGDSVFIDIDQLGSLATPVEPAAVVGSWLAARRLDPGLAYEPVNSSMEEW